MTVAQLSISNEHSVVQTAHWLYGLLNSSSDVPTTDEANFTYKRLKLMTDERYNRPILSDNKKSADFIGDKFSSRTWFKFCGENGPIKADLLQYK